MRKYLAVALLPLVLAACGPTAAEKAKEKQEDEGYEAQAMCKDFVKDKLKAPATADFSDEQHKLQADGSWLVTGSVDSENSFGAKIRGSFSCTMTLSADEKTWHGTDITVG